MPTTPIQTQQSARQCPVQIQFMAKVWREGEWFVAKCAAFEVASQGHTEQEALDNLKEALELYFEPVPHLDTT